MISEVKILLDEYRKWLRSKTTLRETEGCVEITTPYLDRHNDYLQIYAEKHDGGFILSDDGYVLEDLELSGCKIDTDKREALLETTLNGFGVSRNDKTLQVKASKDNFALRKHTLLQAMLAVNDLFYLASPVVASIFYEDVATWLDLREIRYAPRVKFTGKSGYDHMFDFIIPKSGKEPERILRTVNRPGRDTAQAVAFSWIDTKDVRPPESRAYAILNDSENPVPDGVYNAFLNYGVRPISWSDRDRMSAELAA